MTILLQNSAIMGGQGAKGNHRKARNHNPCVGGRCSIQAKQFEKLRKPSFGYSAYS